MRYEILDRYPRLAEEMGYTWIALNTTYFDPEDLAESRKGDHFASNV